MVHRRARPEVVVLNGRIAPDRIDWVYRQILAGGDLRGAERFEDARRARHVRGAHHTWGVALGLDISVERDGSLTVSPGLAYDFRSRELLVQHDTSVYPTDEQVAAGDDLVVAARSKGDDAIPAADLRVVSDRDPLILGRDVPLGVVTPGTWYADQRNRPHVARLAPPRIRSGFVAAGGAAATVQNDHLEATIDTTAAGFTSTPIYLVQALRPTTAPPPGILGPLVSVRNDYVSVPTATSFVAVIRYAAAGPAAVPQPAGGGLPVSLVWVGFEPPVTYGVTEAPDPPCPCLV
jgi:hypothetical protein